MDMLKLSDDLAKCCDFIQVACMALDNKEYFSGGDKVGSILNEALKILQGCMEDIESNSEK